MVENWGRWRFLNLTCFICKVLLNDGLVYVGTTSSMASFSVLSVTLFNFGCPSLRLAMLRCVCISALLYVSTSASIAAIFCIPAPNAPNPIVVKDAGLLTSSKLNLWLCYWSFLPRWTSSGSSIILTREPRDLFAYWMLRFRTTGLISPTHESTRLWLSDFYYYSFD